MSSNIKERGFTLVELLAVIVTIMILAGMLYPALRSIREGPKKAQAKADIFRLELAIQSFYNEYGRWPANPPSIAAFYSMLNANRSPLTGAALGGPYDAQNPRAMQFMEFDKKFVNAAGEFIDPWGNAYTVLLDNGSNDIGPGSFSPDQKANDGETRSPNLSRYQKPILIYSFGPNTVNDSAIGPAYDDITNWY
jgi:type II secretory pathway pseudopilin PulG